MELIHQGLFKLFEQALGRTPDAPALIWENGTLTYSQLDAQINQIANGLGPLSGKPVGILAHKTPLAYAAVLAILRQGGTYVPLNPSFPAIRNRHILERAGIDTLVVGEECSQPLEALLQPSMAIRLLVTSPSLSLYRIASQYSATSLVFCLDNAPCLVQPPAEHAYILFTSGSTGLPKGVMVRQSNVISYVRNFLSLYPIHSEDRLSQTFDLTFDLSAHDQFVCWAAGACLVSYPDHTLLSPLEWTARHGVTVWFSVPSVVAFLEGSRQVVPEALPAIRLSLFCGEKLTWKTCGIWKTIAPMSRIANLYGPTEATIAITHFEIQPSFREEGTFHGGIPIGAPFPGQLLELREEGTDGVTQGAIGQLWLSGDQITDGYLGDPSQTRERFVPDRTGRIWYRTGDLALIDRQGRLQFAGREDSQIKFMGYRIELGEIENAILRTTQSPWAIACTARIRGEHEEIVAFLPKSYASTKASLKSALKKLLPPYMVPRHFFFDAAPPLNSNGKIDRLEIRRRAEIEEL